MGSVIDINGTAEITAPACVMETAAVIEGHPVIDMGHVGILTVRQLLAFQVYIRGFIQDLIDARGRRPGARKHSGHAVCIQYAGPVPVDPDMLSGDIDSMGLLDNNKNVKVDAKDYMKNKNISREE